MTHESDLAEMGVFTEIVVTAPDRGLLAAALHFALQSKSTLVVDQPSLEGASDTLREVATLSTRLEADRKTKKAPIISAGKELDAQYSEADRALKDARGNIEQQMSAYQRSERIKREEAAQAQREFLAKEQARLDRLARAAQERGDAEKAAAFEDRAAAMDMAPAPAVAPMAKLEGVFTRENWTYEITDESLLPREYLIPDMKAIAGIAKALKSRASVPGVRFYNDEGFVAKGITR